MLYPCPPANINVPKSSVCVNSLPTILLYKLPYEIVCIKGVLVPAYVDDRNALS